MIHHLHPVPALALVSLPGRAATEAAEWGVLLTCSYRWLSYLEAVNDSAASFSSSSKQPVKWSR